MAHTLLLNLLQTNKFLTDWILLMLYQNSGLLIFFRMFHSTKMVQASQLFAIGISHQALLQFHIELFDSWMYFGTFVVVIPVKVWTLSLRWHLVAWDSMLIIFDRLSKRACSKIHKMYEISQSANQQLWKKTKQKCFKIQPAWSQ